VYLHKNNGSWGAFTDKTGSRLTLGFFASEKEAAMEVDRANKEFADTHNITVLTPAMVRKTSKHKGVSWNKKRHKWYAYHITNGKMKNLGLHDTETDALKAISAYPDDTIDRI